MLRIVLIKNCVVKISASPLTAAVIGVWLILAPALASADAVNVYSARHYDTDLALYETFTERTGITVNLIEGGSDALIERIVNEGEYTPADLLITVDAGRLWRAQERGVFQPVSSKVLEERIPAYLREAGGHWFGLSKRARVIAYAKGKELPVSITRYEDLADPALKGQICMRPSSNIYNLSLMASLIDAHGAEAAQAWAEGVVKNFARTPQGNDTANLMAVASGECGITIANTYYIGRWLNSDDPRNRAVTEKLEIVFPNQGDRGTHVNIRGVGGVAGAEHRENAIAFLEFLVSPEAQQVFANSNNEYPVVEGVSMEPIVAELGDFKVDEVNVSAYGRNNPEVVKLVDRVGWK